MAPRGRCSSSEEASKGGIYGNRPNINESALNDDGNTPYSESNSDPVRSIDVRDVYGTVLEHWAGVPHAEVLNLMPLDIAGPAAES